LYKVIQNFKKCSWLVYSVPKYAAAFLALFVNVPEYVAALLALFHVLPEHAAVFLILSQLKTLLNVSLELIVVILDFQLCPVQACLVFSRVPGSRITTVD
jgi:hypothetical protein